MADSRTVLPGSYWAWRATRGVGPPTCPAGHSLPHEAETIVVRRLDYYMPDRPECQPAPLNVESRLTLITQSREISLFGDKSTVPGPEASFSGQVAETRL